MIEQDTAIQQLWYAWSNVGIDTIRAGFRIRAASEGLRDIYSPRMEILDRYQRYSLPLDVNPVFIEPDMAPACLSLIITDVTPEYQKRERILVYKTFSGRDGVGRFGAFFIHLLADLPEGFSVEDAILLWKSPILKTSDASLDERDTYLNPVSLPDLKSMRKPLPLNPKVRTNKQTIQKIAQFLPYIIQAYLTKKPIKDETTGQMTQQQLYIADSSDDDVALLIAGLASSLPKSLMRGLTFSTYERDVTKATTEIVGACGLSIRNTNSPPSLMQYVQEYNASHVPYLFPAHYYQEKLAINCSTLEATQFENSPLVFNKPLAVRCAKEATRNLLLCYTEKFEKFKTLTYDERLSFSKQDEDFKILSDFEELFDECESYYSLEVEEFLTIYENIIEGKLPSLTMINKSLRPRSPAEFKLMPRYQTAIIFLVVSEPNWWGTLGRVAISNLRNQSVNLNLSQVAEILSRLVHRAIKEVGNVVMRSDLLVGRIPAKQILVNEEATFGRIEDLIFCATVPDAEATISLSLLDELRTINNVRAFFNHHRNIYVKLMHLWISLLPFSEDNYARLRPLLTLSWAGFGYLLSLGLPLDWNERVARELISQSPLLNKEELDYLQISHSFLAQFFQQLSQDVRRQSIAKDLFSTLAASAYGGKQDLLFILLDSPMGRDGQVIQWLIQADHLTPRETAPFLEQFGPRYLILPGDSEFILTIFEGLVTHDVYNEKMRVLFTWFDSSKLSQWLRIPDRGKELLLTSILKAAQLNLEEDGKFLSAYGQTYFRLYPKADILWDRYNRYAASGSQPRLPTIWFNPQLDQRTFARGLKTAQLTLKERKQFLESLDANALARFSQILLSYVKEYLDCLQNADIDIFGRSPAPDMPSSEEQFLLRLSQSFSYAFIQNMAYDWATVGALVRNPSFRQINQGRPNPEMIAESMDRLFRDYKVSLEIRTKLIEKLARACVESESQLLNLIYIFYGTFPPEDLLLLLYSIAETVRSGFEEKRYPETLFLRFIQFAFDFKTAFLEEEAQKKFVKCFLDTLLLNIDRNVFDRLYVQANKFPFGNTYEWRVYELLYLHALNDSKPSRIDQIKFSWECRGAFRSMKKALNSKNPKRIVQVYTKYMTTLSRYNQQISDEWWGKINKATKEINKIEAVADVSPELQKHIPTAESTSIETRSRLDFAKDWWQREVAFIQIILALRSRNIGQIVQVVTENRATLDRYDTKVPSYWWYLIDAAFDFYQAFEETNEDVEESEVALIETALVDASDKLELLACRDLPAPRLTAHEKWRVECAKQYLASQAKQRMKDALLMLSRARMGPLKDLIPNTTPVKSFLQKVFGRFRR